MFGFKTLEYIVPWIQFAIVPWEYHLFIFIRIRFLNLFGQQQYFWEFRDLLVGMTMVSTRVYFAGIFSVFMHFSFFVENILFTYFEIASLWMCVHVYVNVCVCMCGGWDTEGDKKRVLDPLELELQAIVNCPVSVLGIELGSSPRAVRILNSWSVSLAPLLFFWTDACRSLSIRQQGDEKMTFLFSGSLFVRGEITRKRKSVLWLGLLISDDKPELFSGRQGEGEHREASYSKAEGTHSWWVRMRQRGRQSPSHMHTDLICMQTWLLES